MLPWWLASNPTIDLEKAKKRKIKILIKESDEEKYPHTCPKCQHPAFIGLNNVSCSNKECENFGD